MLAVLLLNCASEKLVIADGAPQASIELNAYGMGRHDETRISLADKIECSTFLWTTQANRKATPVVSVTLAQPKNSARLPAGRNTLLVIGQKIDDRTAVLFWEMFIKPNAKYLVSVKNEVKDRFVFGSPASALAITVLENGIPLNIKQVAAPTEEDCKQLESK
jgi:hypothetical protein